MAQTEDQIEGFSYQNFASVLLKFINIKNIQWCKWLSFFKLRFFIFKYIHIYIYIILHVFFIIHNQVKKILYRIKTQLVSKTREELGMDVWYNDKLKNDSSFKDKLEAIRSVKKENWCDSADPVRSGQKLDCNSLTFVFFFTKTTSFWFKKKLTRSKPGF